ncbi:MAG: rhodanese-like domain-containing protein [Gammaproteobacteria bacterium]|nr:rhodanese-like domain-containing protein [Gammaproteobacteria bacterium]
MEKTFEEKLAEAKQNVASVSPQEANRQKQGNPAIVFIDPRDRADIRSTTGIIPGALNISLSDINGKPTDELPAELEDTSSVIFTTCQGGPMGALAAHALQKRGYQNVRFIDGGTQGWLDAGFSTH